MQVNKINYFINENNNIKKNIVKIIKNVALFDKDIYDLFLKTKLFINNNQLFSNTDNLVIFK